LFQIGEVELTISVGERDAIEACRFEPAAKCGTVAAVDCVPDHSNSANLWHQVDGIIGTTIVDDENLPWLESPRESSHRFRDSRRNDSRFVERGNDQTQPWAIHAGYLVGNDEGYRAERLSVKSGLLQAVCGFAPTVAKSQAAAPIG